MKQSRRAFLGFLIAPVVPTVFLYLFGVWTGEGNAAVVLPFFATVFGYVGAVLIGIPMYLLMQRRGLRSFRSYLLLGSLIGPIFYLVTMGLLASPGHQMQPLIALALPILVLAVYTSITAGVFWLIVFKRKVYESERYFMSLGLD